MLTGPNIKIAADLLKMDRYFSLDYHPDQGFRDMIIDRQRFERVSALLKDKEFSIKDPKIIHEFCFIILWIEEEISARDEKGTHSGKHYQMQSELDNLNKYFHNHRITSVSFTGDYGKNKPGETFTMKDPTNIDRVCDGIRSIFEDEFNQEETKKGRGRQTAWKKKRMSLVKDRILHYLESVPDLDSLNLETQFYIIGRLAALSGFYTKEEDFDAKMKAKGRNKHDGGESYREYLVQNIKSL